MSETQDYERSWYITAHITYRMRWKINQMKLMLQDLDTLTEKYHIGHELKAKAVEECEEYLIRLAKAIEEETIRKKKLLAKVRAT
jgi:hypothetical protein